MLLHQFRSRVLDRENLWWLLCEMFGPKPLYFAAADDAQTITSPHLKVGSKTSSGLCNVFIVIAILCTKANFLYSIATALASDFTADKFFPLRLTGASMRQIIQILPIQSGTTALNVFQLAIFRVFGFGDKSHLTALALPQSTPPNFNSLATTITAWGGPSNIALPVYGNFQVVKSKIPTMLTLLWEFSQALHNDYTTRKTAGAALTFASVYKSLADKRIPSLPSGGIIPWVLVSDYVEYGICLSPTAQDLAEHIMPSSKSSKGSPSGPTAGLKHAADISKEEMPKDAAALAGVLRKIMQVLMEPGKEMKTVMKLVGACEEVQGRRVSVVDVEHALCKVSRQLGMVKKVKG
ncbi:hypothetical protein BGZ57DRAFT_855320 [Hyaloscypha finlandica]|nr:hypothetical protein BGZ57DRAFT_855320 [Hyaloscypha finlandica]